MSTLSKNSKRGVSNRYFVESLLVVVMICSTTYLVHYFNKTDIRSAKVNILTQNPKHKVPVKHALNEKAQRSPASMPSIADKVFQKPLASAKPPAQSNGEVVPTDPIAFTTEKFPEITENCANGNLESCHLTEYFELLASGTETDRLPLIHMTCEMYEIGCELIDAFTWFSKNQWGESRSEFALAESQTIKDVSEACRLGHGNSCNTLKKLFEYEIKLNN